MTVADYMAECLMHPRHGYYTTRDPLGTSGDFTTAPEISQMFGEMIALWLGQVWTDQGRPDPFVLAELGPGRGTLMADILRTIRIVPGMAAAARVHLVEASPVLRERQAAALAGQKATWHPTVADLPDDLPLFLVANEFFDALPIRQIVRTETGWAERLVGLRDGQLAFGLGPPLTVPLIEPRLGETVPGDIIEICPSLPVIAAEIASRIAGRGGAALVVDYGGWRSLGDTLQAVRGHERADPLDDPGAADLTAHVDFEALARSLASGGAVPTAMTPQGQFLEGIGIGARAEMLARRLSGAARDGHLAALRRLTHPSEMGRLFQVIGCRPPGSPLLPGLDMP